MTLSLDRNYTITGYIARGADGSIYEGFYQEGDKVQEVIFKIYLGGFFFNVNPLESFNNEKYALSKLGRLIYSDETNLMIIMPKIKGVTLSEVVKKLRLNINDDENQTILKDLMEKYLKLPAEFQNKWEMVHMDIHPGNVMIDEDGKMVLIDFSRSKPLYENGERDHVRSNLDHLHAKLGAAFHFNVPIDELTEK